MPELHQFDWLIKQTLTAKADLIPVDNNMGERVRAKLAALANYTPDARQIKARNIKIAIAAVVCFLFVGTGFSLLLPDMNKAGAADKSSSILNKINVLLKVKTNDGGATIATSELIFVNPDAQSKADTVAKASKKVGFAGFGPIEDVQEASKQAGFKIKVPTYLPAGAIKPEQFVVAEGREEDGKGGFVSTGEHIVSMRFSNENGAFKGLAMIISEKMPLTAGYDSTAVDINGDKALFTESELTLNEENEGKQLPDRTLIERKLCWQEDGLTYLLTDYTGLSQDELIKIAESLK